MVILDVMPIDERQILVFSASTTHTMYAMIYPSRHFAPMYSTARVVAVLL
jgi:hypothetical protein